MIVMIVMVVMVVIDVDYSSIIQMFADVFDDLSVSDIEGYVVEGEKTFKELVLDIIAKYTAEYPETNGGNDYVVTLNAENLEYESKYSFYTDSIATDENYVYTDYTNDIGNIALVTYEKKNSDGTVDKVQFILNYNIYTVTVDLGDGKVRTLGKYEYERIG